MRVDLPGCLSCDILAGRKTAPGGTIHEDDFWLVDSAAGPATWRGFLIIKLKRHCEQLAELTPDEAAALGPVVRITCAAVAAVLKPAKVYVCSFGDGVRHIHFWVLPRPAEMPPGMMGVMRRLTWRGRLARLGIRRWVIPDAEVARLAGEIRTELRRLSAAGQAGGGPRAST